MIANPDFARAGAAPGEAAGWALRSFCALESIAAFAGSPPASFENFERWSGWVGSLETATFAPFGGSETIENFDGWPNPLFASELSEGLVKARMLEGFESGWWLGAQRFVWADVQAVVGAFASGSMETFDKWRPSDVYLLAFSGASLTQATFHGEASEIFDAWTTKNATL